MFIDDKIAERLGGRAFGQSTEIYKFEKIKQAKRKALEKNPLRPIIDLGVGEPDQPAHASIVNVLAEEAGKAENRFYADNGIAEFQQAAGRFMKQVFRVNIDSPEKQIIHGIGTKPILAMLPFCFMNSGDILLNPSPGYPVPATYTRYLGAQVYNMPLLKENNFYPDFSSVSEDILRQAKLLYLIYPNNPTGQTATRDFFQQVLDLSDKYNFFVINDAAYSTLTYDGYEPLSILSLPGAMERAVEIHSLSKSYNMTGWRLGFAVGNEKAIKAYGAVKDNTDSGQFRAIQKAGAYALDHPELIEVNRERYSRRLNLLVKTFKELGFEAIKPKASFYLYLPAPIGAGKQVFQAAAEVSTFLIEEASVSTVPWDEAGRFLRVSATFEANGFEDELRVMAEVKERLQALDLRFRV
ncbi:MAG: LL-diaminopimelate aminotransferase [Spirochaetales bacterium]|nr:LL-diaminopimelate aminotransferase [Spirochaetales bacterium]